MKWKVTRKDPDFYTLRKIMVKQFPHILIPPLPAKAFKWIQKVISKREKLFGRFLAAIGRSEELKSAVCFESFVQLEDIKVWEKQMKVAANVKYSKNLADLITRTGTAPV